MVDSSGVDPRVPPRSRRRPAPTARPARSGTPRPKSARSPSPRARGARRSRSISVDQILAALLVVEADRQPRADALAGMTLVAGLPTVTSVTSMFDGWNQSIARIEHDRVDRRRAPRPAWGSDCRRGADRRRGPAVPGTSIQILTDPRRPILIVSPSRVVEVGSPTRHKSGVMPALGHAVDQRAGAVDRRAFLVAGDDQAERRRPFGARGAAATNAAIAPFMSTAPRPWSRSPRTSGSNAPLVQPSPGGTTSRCPAKARCGPAAARAPRAGSRPARRAPRRRRSDRPRSPSGASAASSTSNTAPARGRDAFGRRSAPWSDRRLGARWAPATRWRRHCPSSTSTQSRRPTRPAIRADHAGGRAGALVPPPRAGRRARPISGSAMSRSSPAPGRRSATGTRARTKFGRHARGRGGAGRR